MVAESGVPGFGYDNCMRCSRPAAWTRRSPREIHEVVVKALAEPDTQKLLLGQGLDPVGSSRTTSATCIAEIARWRKW